MARKLGRSLERLRQMLVLPAVLPTYSWRLTAAIVWGSRPPWGPNLDRTQQERLLSTPPSRGPHWGRLSVEDPEAAGRCGLRPVLTAWLQD